MPYSKKLFTTNTEMHLFSHNFTNTRYYQSNYQGNYQGNADQNHNGILTYYLSEWLESKR